MQLAKKGKLLFVPASGPKGTGEYFRSLNIARYIKRQRPDVVIHFLLSSKSLVSSSCEFGYTLLPDTPAYSTTEVNEVISDFNPDVVFFDATGRAAQLRKAKLVGAHTVFIAQNSRVLSRGLGLNRLKYLDELWVVQPREILAVTGYNRIKAMAGNVAVKYVGAVFPLIDDASINSTKKIYPLLDEPYILMNPGGGGHRQNGHFVVDEFYKEAKDLHSEHSLPVLLICGPNYPKSLPSTDGVEVLASADPAIFNVLVSKASLFVSGGGGALFQAMAYGIPTLAVAISPDQQHRIDQLSSASAWIESVSDIDLVSETRFPDKPEGLDDKLPTVYQLLDDWLD